MRRTPKPFTVEVRSIAKTTRARPKPQPPTMRASARVAEPPAEPTFAVPAGIALTGRVLPVLDDPKPPLVPAKSKLRHWPAVPGLTIDSTWPESHEVAGEPERAGALKHEVEASTDEAVRPATAPEADTHSAAAISSQRKGRLHLPREAFRREERWKARLPAVMQRTRKRGT